MSIRKGETIIANKTTPSTYTQGEGISISAANNISISKANSSSLGGVKADIKTAAETQEVKIDSSTGKLYVAPSTNISADGTTIENNNNIITTIAIKDNNNTSNAIKTWTGTLAQYNAITTKDANTIYNITDDEVGSTTMYTKAEVDTLIANTVTTVQGLMNTQLSTLYPIGSIYIGTTATCPLATLISGSTWVLVGEDRVLQGAGTRGGVGTTVDESLPNITGTVGGGIYAPSSGCGYKIDSSVAYESGSWMSSGGNKIGFDASRSSSTYQDDAPVQPDAYLVNIWRRVL